MVRSRVLLAVRAARSQSREAILSGTVTVTDVCDNVAFDDRLDSRAWGFAAIIENPAGLTLFDTTSDGDALLANMTTLGYDPRRIRRVFLSHEHWDHTGGLEKFLQSSGGVEVFGCVSFPDEIKNLVASAGGQFTGVAEAQEIAAGLVSTGTMSATADEQSLVLETADCLCLVTGCAHPGVVEIVKKARELVGSPVRVVLGGFHLEEADQQTLEGICDALQGLGVERIGASHCTGEAARAMMKQRWGSNWIELGCGARISFP